MGVDFKQKYKSCLDKLQFHINKSVPYKTLTPSNVKFLEEELGFLVKSKWKRF